MRVLLLSQGADTGGGSARTAAAFRKWRPGWQVQSLHVSDNFIGYPGDLRWSQVDVQALYDAADVVQVHQWFGCYGDLDHDQHKPVVFYHHGTALRMAPISTTAVGEHLGATQAVSTIDLIADCPPAQWAPVPFDLDWLASIREQEAPSPGRRRIRIAHAPTNRRVKDTEYVLAVLERLSAFYPIELDLIERVTWTECLTRKARADILIDQLALGYGSNAVEAWAMGIPVVVGFSDPSDVERAERLWGGLPFPNVTAQNLEAALVRLLDSPALRSEDGERGRDHVRRWHDERAVVESRAALWSDAQRRPSAGSSALLNWSPPAEPKVGNPIPPAPKVEPSTSSPPSGALPRMGVRRGRAGYRGEVVTYDRSRPGLVLV